ncbi:MAG: hypothetical protein IKO43_03065 [Kiritimatiellae bacterium]|nr:hypothetical protein [Kiritimatiellia bacterium]
MKPVVNYEVRVGKDPSTGNPLYLPAIIDRTQTVDLEEVVTQAIDRSLIVGVKANAAKSIAEGVAEELYHQFSRGNSIAFGKYFYGRLYLDGTVQQDGNLASSRNHVNVRLIKGDDFKLSLSDFSWHNVDATSRVTITNVQSVGSKVANTLKNGQAFALYGTNLNLFAGDSVTASWEEEGSDEPRTLILQPTENDFGHIKVNWPQDFSDLAGGTEILFTVENHPDGLEKGSVTTTHSATIE